ncbi:hypothetical protein NDK43_05570 [Neobacillus pocheonensis]|uniref:Uncharacterized protein n=1 Tax=Neobacillus pocheonensis TaxID=363869 RepID=A0ABT0W6J8_9BACI|nr:hypothetical protein [Neobacillus pocheonensis]
MHESSTAYRTPWGFNENGIILGELGFNEKGTLMLFRTFDLHPVEALEGKPPGAAWRCTLYGEI